MTNYINNPDLANSVRYPRARVILSDGTILPAPISFDVTTTNNLTADTFSITFPLYYDPQYNCSWWQSQTALQVSVQIGYARSQYDLDVNLVWNTIVSGQIDEFDLHIDGGIVVCTGRDLSSNFIDTKIETANQNMTSSAIAQQLAAGHGMQTDIDSTDTPVGRYYSQDHTNIHAGQFSQARTEWDLLCYLAKKEMYDLYVKGNTLYFKKATDPSNSSTHTFSVQATQYISPQNGVVVWTGESNVEDLRFHRSLTLAKDIKVVVVGWHSKNGKSFKATAERNKGSVSSGKVQEYVFNAHNITQAEAQARANAYLADLSKHEYVVTFDAPGDNTLTAQCLVEVQGTLSGFDISYFIDQIHYTFSTDGGFHMSVKAKNHNNQNETTV